MNDLTQIERQLIAIVFGMSGQLDKLALLQVIQCAMYQVRENDDPHGRFAVFESPEDREFFRKLTALKEKSPA
jgi:hypothetical protein